MDREKKQLKRPGSKVKPLHVSDFIALGSKSSSRQTELGDPKIKTKTSSLLPDRKSGESSSSSSGGPIAVKKVKLSSTKQRTPARKETVKSDEWDTIAVEVDAAELVVKVLEAEDISDDDKVEALICGAAKKLKASRSKVDAPLYLGLQYLVKYRPSLFHTDTIVEALCSLLKRDLSANFKVKGSNLVPILAANVLMAAYKDESIWPEAFVKAYIDDSLGERTWVDHDYCKGFVDNILTAFNTKSIPKSLMVQDRLSKPEACPSPLALGTDDDESCSSMNMEIQENFELSAVYPRYTFSEEILTQHVLDVFKEQMARRQPAEVSRNTLRFLVSTCGISEIRLGVAQKLEMWLQNPKLTKPAQELLLALCLNCNLHNQNDIEVISQLVKVRIKAKPIINHYLQCMKELLSQHQDNLGSLLKHAIYNELSNSRNPNNMQLLAVIFQHSPDRAASVLADVFSELLLNKDDYLRALRVLLREIARTVRHDLNFGLFCQGLMRPEPEVSPEPALRERQFLAIADLVVLAVFLGAGPAVKEQFTIAARGERKDCPALRAYQMQVAHIQHESVRWLHSTVQRAFKPGRNEFLHAMHKMLFVEQVEHYCNKDNWPGEGERMLLLRVASEVPLLQDTLIKVLLTGLSRDHLLAPPEALELADQLVKRAALTHCDSFPVLDFENTELCEIIFNLCAYHHPENYTLPSGYHPPNLAISELYWKAWTMLLIIICHNPSSFGEMAWKTCPMLRNLMEMCITNQFVFPPPTLGEKAEELHSRELQMSQIEREEIVAFESHLAGVAITESNSLLVSKLISMDPHGPARRPPAAVLEQLRLLNGKLRLGELLCRSRKPDFLLDVIQRQGATQSMAWLSELVEASASSFDMLPVQCLCEFLVSGEQKKRRKQEQLLQHLRRLLREGEPRDTLEVAGYFVKRLGSQQSSARALALKGLDMLLAREDEMEVEEPPAPHAWLLRSIPQLPHFAAFRSQMSVYLRQSCQIESDPSAIAAYVAFLAAHTPDQQEFADLALDMAQMIVERPTVVNTILLLGDQDSDFLASVSEIFYKYLSAARTPSKEVYSWSESQDQILIQWASGESATMHILVVHAMIIVLTYGPPPSAAGRGYFEALLSIWFAEQPKAFLVDTSEEALLLPDWLKLRMIRSSVGVLVDAALKDLDPSQLVLFIQSFGIPVASMSKLLRTLDLAVECDSFSVEQAVLDKGYMSQLVEVQHRRGASGGGKFAALLLAGEPPEPSIGEPHEPSPLQHQATPVIQRAPPKPPTAPVAPDAVGTALLQLLGLDGGQVLSARREQELFKGLQKALSSDILRRDQEGTGAVGVFVLACEQLLRSADLKDAFLQALHRKSYYSSVLFRLATASQAKGGDGPLALKLRWICQQVIYNLSSAASSPLLTVASQFYNKSKPPETRLPVPWKRLVRQFDAESADGIKAVVQMAEAEDPLRLEEVMQYLVRRAITKGDSKPLMNAMTNITVKRLVTSQAPSVINRSKFCFFVDWLECLEPKIVSSFPESQCHLLFSLITLEGEPISVPFRPYLLALLIHQSSWEILHYYIRTVLNPLRSDIKFDPSSVLDFLHACIYIPKIWQGRYKKSKSGAEEDILALSSEQMEHVVDFILEEAVGKCDPDPANGVASIEVRMILLMKCLSLKPVLVEASVKHLLDVVKEGGPKGDMGRELLLHAYHRIPSILTTVSGAVEVLSERPSEVKAAHCRLDAISHTLVLSLARTDASKQCLAKMVRIEFILKKMAATHPLLLLRQLPMVTSLLRGRSHLDYHAFRTQNHAALFGCCLSVLELLGPTAFRSDEHCASLHALLALYVEVFAAYGTPKEVVHLLNRFVGFLSQYVAARPAQARAFATLHADALGDHPDLRAALTGMHYRAADSDAVPGGHISPSLATRLSQGAPEEVGQALQELEAVSYKRPGVLEHVADGLRTLMHDANPHFRMAAFNLVMRYVKHSPGRGRHFLSSYLQCLESEQVDVVLTALEHLPEFTVLVQEYAPVLLQKTFNIGMLKSVNTAAQIKGTISYLVAQGGC